MRDITRDVLRAVDTRRAPRVTTYGRLDILLSQLSYTMRRLDRRKPIRILVLNSAGGPEKEETGGYRKAQSLMESYNVTYQMTFSADVRKNTLYICLGEPLRKAADAPDNTESAENAE